MDKVLGGEIVARMLKNEGVEKVFGIIDGTYFGFYSSLEKNGIELVSPRHEACAAHMAGAYARTTGKLGVCMASNGPGVANVLPGVAVENGEGNRVLLITSCRRVGIAYPDRGGTFQYFNQVGVIKPMSKWSGAVPSFDRIPEFMKRAFRKSFQGRPGVVHVDIPENLLNSKTVIGPLPQPSTYRRTEPIVPGPAQVEAAADLLASAKQPLIHAGSGIIHAQAFAELQTVADLLQAPVCTSWGGRGAIREDQDLAIPMWHVALNDQVRNDADVVLALGTRLGETDWWGKAPNWKLPAEQKLIQVDNDEDNLGMNKPAAMNVLADAKVFLADLAKALESRKGSIDLNTRKSALDRYRAARQKKRDALDKHAAPNEPLNAAQVGKVCQDFFAKDAIFVMDGGNTAVWANFFHEARHTGTLLATAKFGMLGAGVAQATGAAVAHPDRQVYCLIGDGAMGFNQQEVETAIRNNLKIVFLVCCDKQWGMVKMNQQFALKPVKTIIKKSLGPDETINADFNEIQFDKLAESMGAHGERVSKLDDLRPALERCVAAAKCAVIHIDVDPVKHMWAPSLVDFKKMHAEPKGK